MKIKADSDLPVTSKHPGIILTALVFGFIVLGMIIWHLLYLYKTLDFPFAYLAIVNFSIWWAMLLWGSHHTLFQLLALFKKPNVSPDSNAPLSKIAILYVTCDDFNTESCQSCCDQEYSSFQVYICDDSQTNAYKTQIDEFCNKHPSCQLVRRDNLKGFKAGNLNYAIHNKVKEEWLLLVDADQFLPVEYLVNLVKKTPSEDPNVAFIQSAHGTRSLQSSSIFQKAMEPEVAMFYERSLSLREKFGFIPMLGHGVLVRRSTWDEVGKFPEIVSEDFAFAIEITSKSKYGIYVEGVKGFEDYPYDFGGFMIRVKKWAGGTAELIKWKYSRSKTLPFVENWDFGMQVFGYIMAPFIFVNSFIGSYVLHKLWNEYTIWLNPSLPYLYSFLLFVTIAVVVSISKNTKQAIVFYFWATAIYTASLPIIGITFLKYFFISPTFQRTPKNGTNTSLGFWDSALMIMFGCLILGSAYYWFSPFSYVLYGVGSAYLAYPLFGQLSSTSLIGKLSRIIVYLPGIFMLYALYVMWFFGRY